MLDTVTIAAALLAAVASPAASDTIVVQGRSEPMLRRYVDTVVRPEQGHQLARWNQPICLAIEGLAPGYAQFIERRIVMLAHDLRVPVLPRGCAINVSIRLTDRADAIARALVEARPKRIGNLTGGTLLPRPEIAAIEAPRTIRWLTASETTGNDGMPLSIANGEVPINFLYAPSLIRSAVREDVVGKIVLIDEAKLAAVTLSQLADYLAFVVFATPDLAADFTGTDSILALFPSGAGAAPPGLTGQDRAVPAALYATEADRTAAQQKAAIRTRLRRAR